MKSQTRSFALVMVVVGSVLLHGCSKNKDAQSFAQVNEPAPNPAPTVDPTPTPTATPTPTPTATVTPRPTPTPTVPPSPSACTSGPFKEFANFSSFVFNQAKFQGMNISHGVASSTLALDGVEIGYGLERNLGRYDIIGNQVDLAWIDAVSGGVAYATTLKFHEGVDVYGVIKKTAAIDFPAAKLRATDLQLRLLDIPMNGTVKTTCPANKVCETVLTGTHPTVNRFTLAKNQLPKGARVIINVPKKATAIVVIDEQNIKLDDLELRVPAETIWTLSKRGGKFTIDFMTLTGTVVLLDSTFEMDQALLMGRVISNSFTSTECRSDAACSTIDSQESPEKICL